MNMTVKNSKLRVLNLEDNPNDSELIRATLENEWAELEWLRVDSRATFLKALEEFKPDVVLSDFKLPDMNGQEALAIVRQFHPEIPVVMVTGALTDVDAVELVKLGARDYVIKDRLHRLISAVHGALSLEQGIRARKLAEEALRASEADMRALIEHSPIAMIVDTGIDADGKVVVVNQKFTELFGYTLADLPNVSYWWPLAYPDKEYREKIKANFEIIAWQAIQNKSKTNPVETTVTCKDGSTRHVKITFASISKKNIVTFEDLTEHKQAENKIQRLNQLYALLSHCNQTIVRSKDEQELFTHICHIAVQHGDFKMAWIGRINPDTQMIVPVASAGAGADEYLRDIKISVDANSEYGQGPTGCALRENHPVWCQDFQNSPLTLPWQERGVALGWFASAALPLSREGVVFGAFTLYAKELNAFDEAARNLLLEMATDIDFALDNFSHEAQRQQTEKSLVESEEKFRVMTGSAQDGIIMINGEGKISFWNSAAEKIFGYTKLEVLDKELHQLLTPERFRETAHKGFSHFQFSGAGGAIGKTLELMALRKNGNEFPIELSLSAVNISGRLQAIGIVRDISQRKQIEMQLASQYEHVTGVNTQLLEANKQLEQAQSQLLQSEKMAAIGLLAAGVAHEINNPVGYVNSNLGTLERYLANIFTVMNKSDELCELLNLQNPEVAELKALRKKLDIDFLQNDIKSLLRESREGLERVKKIVLDLKNFSRSESDEHWQWSDIHAGLESTLTIVANELKYKCEVIKEFGTLPQVYCLPSQLSQVFMNLLVNAAQAIKAHGIVTIRTGSADDQVWVEISDSGSGIPDDVLPRIFDPFFTTKPIGRGTGLGLPVSYGIIEHHHGKIEVHSEVGKGSTFRVTLPVQQPTIEEK